MAESDPELVVVFRAEEPELLPLAEAALEQAGIDYTIRPIATRVPPAFGHPAEFGGAEGAADILVRPGDLARAKTLIADLDHVGTAVVPDTAAVPSASVPTSSPRAYRLYDADSKRPIGEITTDQLRFLADELEEESESDQDYYIDAATIDMLATAGADTELLGLLKRAIAGREGAEIAWEKIG